MDIDNELESEDGLFADGFSEEKAPDEEDDYTTGSDLADKDEF
jgi:hypothetical protein